MIHSTHAKKDLHEIIEVFQLYEVGDYKRLKKHELVPILDEVIQKREHVPEDTNNFFIKDIKDLKHYLETATTRQITSNSVRYDVTDRVKNLIFYGKECGYWVKTSNYGCYDEVVADATFIGNFGDLPSARRALRFYNLDPKTVTPILPVMTRRVERRVREIEKQKQNTVLSLRSHQGPFILDFS